MLTTARMAPGRILEKGHTDHLRRGPTSDSLAAGEGRGGHSRGFIISYVSFSEGRISLLHTDVGQGSVPPHRHSSGHWEIIHSFTDSPQEHLLCPVPGTGEWQ